MREVGVRKWISNITLRWHPEALEMAAEAGRTELSEYEGYWCTTWWPLCTVMAGRLGLPMARRVTNKMPDPKFYVRGFGTGI